MALRGCRWGGPPGPRDGCGGGGVVGYVGGVQLSTFVDPLAPSGLNLVGVASAEAWDAVAAPARRTEALLPGARSIVVIGNAGGALWDALVADLRAHPAHLAAEPHPLDAFVRRALARVTVDAPHRWFRAAADETVHVDFRQLARLAGLGDAGRLGLLMNAEHGPWIGLRAACFVAADLPVSPPRAAPCEGCDAPCVSACPGSAFPGGRWSVDACAAFKQASPVCTDTCAARLACPVGSSFRYSAEQFRYHNDRPGGRPLLRAAAGVADADDAYEGEGPYWGTWRERVDVRGG